MTESLDDNAVRVATNRYLLLRKEGYGATESMSESIRAYYLSARGEGSDEAAFADALAAFEPVIDDPKFIPARLRKAIRAYNAGLSKHHGPKAEASAVNAPSASVALSATGEGSGAEREVSHYEMMSEEGQPQRCSCGFRSADPREFVGHVFALKVPHLTGSDGLVEELLVTAKLLYANSLGCIEKHFGGGGKELPGFMRDAWATIERADAALRSAADTPTTEGER